MRRQRGLQPGAVGACVGRLRASLAAVLALGGLALGSLAQLACAPPGPLEHRVAGRALGTTWSLIVVDDDRSTTPEALQSLAEAALAEVDLAASTWRDDSELAALARSAVGQELPLSQHLFEVLEASRWAHSVSGGAFDPTVAPLVAAYGFGAGAAEAAPDEATRAAAHARVDFSAVQWTAEPPRTLRRTRDDVQLDLSAIAKGYAVDVIAARLRALGEARFLAEVGGELVLSGTRPSGTPWIVSVDAPTTAPPVGPPGSPGRPLYALLAVSDRAVATSGDYRQYNVDAEGRRYTHAIDPRSGRAVANAVASVTVIADTCTKADALATTLMVLGPEAGLALAASLPDVEALLLLHASDDTAAFEERATPGFSRFRKP